jgi:hypothetical protein
MEPGKTEKAGAAKKASPLPESPACGLVMPISATEGCSAEHWLDVKNLLTEAIEGILDPKFSVRLVSDADDVGVIQKRIVQNIYSSDIVVCDVSSKNPNVMFELGMRLAFDKPTVIVKDDKTDYVFDTGIIEHVSYPRDLRFNKIVTFKSTLAEKVRATYHAGKTDPKHSTFLKNFGTFHVASLTQDTVPADKFIVAMLSELQSEISSLKRVLGRDRSRANSDRTEDGGAVSIVIEVTKYLAEHPTAELTGLLDDDKFAREIARKSNAYRYFQTFADFKKTLDGVLAAMAESRAQT